jgi:hypothetical protein
MYINKRKLKSALIILAILGPGTYPQMVLATDTVSMTMTGVIQAPAESQTKKTVGVVAGESQQPADTISVTMTGMIQAPATTHSEKKMVSETRNTDTGK